MEVLKTANITWDDTGVLKSAVFDDIYFQKGLGLEESGYVFLGQNDLAARFAALPPGALFSIGELGFGSGLNFLLAADLFLKEAPPSCRLQFFSVEKHPLAATDLALVYKNLGAGFSCAGDLLKDYPLPLKGLHRRSLSGGRVTLTLGFGDAAEVLDAVRGMFDCWFLDGFAPAKNPDMWDDKLLARVFALTRAGGTFATFSSAGSVRRGLEAAGFAVEKVKGYGVKREMLRGIRPGTPNQAPRPKTVTIIGGGIAGCAAAYALVRRGYDVTLVEKNADLARGTSGNPFGVLYPKLTAAASPFADFYLHAFQYTHALLEKMPGAEWRETGVLHQDVSQDRAVRHQKIAAFFTDLPGFCRSVSRDAAQDIAGVALDQGGIFFAQGGFLSPRGFCTELAQGARVVTGKTVSAIKNIGGQWTGHDEHGAVVFSSDILIVTTGVSLKEFLGSDDIPLVYVRGVTTSVAANAQSGDLKTVLCHEGYCLPAVGGRHTLGATFDKVKDAENHEIKTAEHERNLNVLTRNIPTLGLMLDPGAHGYSGTRVYTPDRLPLIGAAPSNEGLYMIGALGGHGLTSAPFAGEIVASMIAGETVPLPHALMKHVWPERFIRRKTSRA